jgi:hypothetical protein
VRYAKGTLLTPQIPMPPSANPLCVQCAKLSRDEAIALHGPEGTEVQCWKVKTCDNRRHYHRNASMFNQVRKQRRQQKGQAPAVSSLGASSTLQLQGDFHPGEAVIAAPRRSRSKRTETVTVPPLTLRLLMLTSTGTVVRKMRLSMRSRLNCGLVITVVPAPVST